MVCGCYFWCNEVCKPTLQFGGIALSLQFHHFLHMSVAIHLVFEAHTHTLIFGQLINFKISFLSLRLYHLFAFC